MPPYHQSPVLPPCRGLVPARSSSRHAAEMLRASASIIHFSHECRALTPRVLHVDGTGLELPETHHLKNTKLATTVCGVCIHTHTHTHLPSSPPSPPLPLSMVSLTSSIEDPPSTLDNYFSYLPKKVRTSRFTPNPGAGVRACQPLAHKARSDFEADVPGQSGATLPDMARGRALE